MGPCSGVSSNFASHFYCAPSVHVFFHNSVAQDHLLPLASIMYGEMYEWPQKGLLVNSVKLGRHYLRKSCCVQAFWGQPQSKDKGNAVSQTPIQWNMIPIINFIHKHNMVSMGSIKSAPPELRTFIQCKSRSAWVWCWLQPIDFSEDRKTAL